MNTTTRVLSRRTMTTTSLDIRAFVFSKTMLYTASLITSVLLSALGLIYTKDVERHLISNSVRLQHSQEALQIKQGQLLLEQHTLTAQGRLEDIAQKQLQMTLPLRAE